MKIGQFARESNVSIDTLRYYMELGLLVPCKKGGHYEFDDSCKEDLHEILQLKEIGFSLQEIKMFFYYKQFVKVENKVSSKYYSTFFERKIKDTRKAIENLRRNLEILEDKLAGFNIEDGHSSVKSGIELSSLNVLCCPGCGGRLMLHKGRIEDNQIMEGYLVCSCGERYEINEGILIIEKKLEGVSGNIGSCLNTDAELLFKYIDSTDSVFLDKVYKSLNWYEYNTKKNDFAGKVVLDLGVGFGFFLRAVFDKLAEDTLYIAIDHDMNGLNLIKNIIESSGSKKNIVYICTDFKRLPIKKETIDVLVDYSGSTNYNFDHKDFLLDSTIKYLKNNSKLYGGYVLFDKFGRRNILKEEYRKNYTLEFVKEKLDSLNFKLLHEAYSEKYYCKEANKYESYQQLGDVIFSYLCIRNFLKPEQ